MCNAVFEDYKFRDEGGEQMELDQAYKLYFKDVYLFLCGLSHNPDIAEEIAQETFFKALKSIDTYEGSKDIRAWLFTIARNAYYSYCRKNRFRTETENITIVTPMQIRIECFGF